MFSLGPSSKGTQVARRLSIEWIRPATTPGCSSRARKDSSLSSSLAFEVTPQSRGPSARRPTSVADAVEPIRHTGALRPRFGRTLALAAATTTHERWSPDFVADRLGDGRAFCALTIVAAWFQVPNRWFVGGRDLSRAPLA
jgi:hypothetical protein